MARRRGLENKVDDRHLCPIDDREIRCCCSSVVRSRHWDVDRFPLLLHEVHEDLPSGGAGVGTGRFSTDSGA